MKFTFKDFLTESDDFTKAIAEIQNNPYLEKGKNRKKNGIDKMQKVFDPDKWRRYLQYLNAGNN